LARAKYSNAPSRATSSSTGAATDKEIVAAVAAREIVVSKFIFTASEAANFTLESASGTAIFKALNVTGLNSGELDDLHTAAGEALTWTTNTGDGELYLEYYLRS